MKDIVGTAINTEQAISSVLAKLPSVEPSMAQTLPDMLTQVGLVNPYDRAIALRSLRTNLRPPNGSHAHLTREKRWAYERERWAKEAGLPKGKTGMDFQPETAATRALVEAAEANDHLPEIARDAVGQISKALADRANRKLDEVSVEMIGDGVHELMREVETQARIIQEKEARIQQEERHNEDLRKTNATLLAIMQQITGKNFEDAVVTSREEKGGTRQRPAN